VLARCPHCRETFSTERTGPQECPQCKRPLVVPEVAPASQPSAPLPVPSPPQPVEQGTPWENRDRLGAFAAWKRTLAMALFEPGKLFAQARLDRGSAQLGFAVLTGSLFWAAGQILDRALFAGQREQALRFLDQMKNQTAQLPPFLRKLFLGATEGQPLWTTVAIALLSPLIVLVLVYLNAAVTHASAMILGQAKRGFAATFAAAAYGLAPMVLLLVPGCGGIVAPVWSAVLTGIGLRQLHGITPGGAAAAVLGPYVLICCGGCMLAVTIGVIMGRSMAGG